MERFRIFDFYIPFAFHQGQYQTIVIKQCFETVVSTLAFQSKIGCQKCLCRQNIVDGEVEMVDFHRSFPPLNSCMVSGTMSYRITRKLILMVWGYGWRVW